MARRKARAKTKVSLGVRFKFLFTGKLPKPKRKAKKRIATDASKGRKRLPKGKIAGVDKFPPDCVSL